MCGISLMWNNKDLIVDNRMENVRNEGEISQRIDFVDLVKGICIILVVMSHVGGIFDMMDYHSMIDCFRMPLYFFISGIFFKSYEGFIGFLKRKLNKLFIPFLFFYFSSFFLMYLLSVVHPSSFKLPVQFTELLYVFQGHELIRYNPPIWFLLALFNCNILFYLIHYFRDKHISLMFLLTLLIGIAGFFLGKYQIVLPCYMDVAMAALPFYVGGFWIRRYNFFLYPHRFDRAIPIIIVVCLIIMYFTATAIGVRTNNYPGNIFQTYIGGFTGIIFIMMLGKLLHSIPFVSYIGRYSIITLCIHGPILHFLFPAVGHFVHNTIISSLFIFVAVMLICYFATPLFRRFFPHLVGQKDIFRITNSK